MLGVVVTAMYDAWAAYDDKAVGTRLGASFRRPKRERTQANKETAVGYATYRALIYLFPEDAKWLGEEVRKKGVDPDNQTVDVSTAAGVGNVTAAALIAYRRADGSNSTATRLVPTASRTRTGRSTAA